MTTTLWCTIQGKCSCSSVQIRFVFLIIYLYGGGGVLKRNIQSLQFFIYVCDF